MFIAVHNDELTASNEEEGFGRPMPRDEGNGLVPTDQEQQYSRPVARYLRNDELMARNQRRDGLIADTQERNNNGAASDAQQNGQNKDYEEGRIEFCQDILLKIWLYYVNAYCRKYCLDKPNHDQYCPTTTMNNPQGDH
ncbi:unnamed protein product [Rotaria sp. Silwood2]|nr:unnamed protein product [Rotaria sp. Silwood2]CAF4381897.1 unnamed protein product [Rotaria sp. Silwood2]